MQSKAVTGIPSYYSTYGAVWTYIMNLPGTPVKTTVACIAADDEFVDGVVHYMRFQEDTFYETDIEVSDTGLLYHSRKTVCGGQLADSIIEEEYVPPFPILKSPLSIGTSWEARDSILNARVTRTVEDIETVNVPAGEFEATRIRVDTLMDDSDEKRTFFEWWSADIGLIKSSGNDLELQHFAVDEEKVEEIIEDKESFEDSLDLEDDLTEEQEYTLAMDALPTERNEQEHDTLYGEYDIEEAADIGRELLQEWWDITDRESLLQIADWLLEEGHNRAYEEDYANNELDIGEEQPPNILGWDLCRLMSIIRWGAAASYLRDEEAWDWLYRCTEILQKNFGSWDDLGLNYLAGQRYWSQSENSEAILEAYEWLSDPDNEDSPWQIYEWGLL